MSHVGVATSFGQLIDVLIILCSLANTLARIPVANLPITYDIGTIVTLDCELNDLQSRPVVSSYLLAWWKGTCQPDTSGILNPISLEACLAHHHHLLLQTITADPIPILPLITIFPISPPPHS